MSFRKYIVLICSGLFVWHFGMIVLHNTPEKYLPARLASYSHLWSYPVFHQGWSLFAPDPQDMTKHLDMRFANEGQWSDWYRADDMCVEGHNRYRMSHYSKLFHVTQNAAYHLWLEMDKFDHQDKTAERYYPVASGYGIAVHYAEQYAFHFIDGPRPDSLQIQLTLIDPFNEEIVAPYSFPTHLLDAE